MHGQATLIIRFGKIRLNFLVLNFYNYTQSGTMHVYHFLDRQYSNSHTIGKFCVLTVVEINLTLGVLILLLQGVALLDEWRPTFWEKLVASFGRVE